MTILVVVNVLVWSDKCTWEVIFFPDLINLLLILIGYCLNYIQILFDYYTNNKYITP